MYILLDTAKKHLNIDKYFAEDDEYIIKLIGVAEDAISKRIDKKLSDIVDPATGYLPQSVIQSILLMVGQLYANREIVTYSTANEVPVCFNFLCDLNKNYDSIF